MSKPPALILAAALLAPAAAAAQSTWSYADIYTQAVNLAPIAQAGATVADLALRRDAGTLTFARGTLYWLTPVNGRPVGVVFRGQGRFSFAPSDLAEQRELRRQLGAAPLETPFTEAILLFTDSALEQLRALRLDGTDPPGDAGDVHDLMESFKGQNEGSYNPDVMGALLNPSHRGFFMAWIKRAGGDPLLFEYNTALTERVRLMRPVGQRLFGTRWAPVCQVLAQGESPSVDWFHHSRLSVPAYRVDSRLTITGSADLRLSAAATLTVVTREPVGPWLNFELQYRIEVDSARAGGAGGAGSGPLRTSKAHEDPEVWVDVGRVLQPGDTVTLTLFYHGNVIERDGDFFFVTALTSWYPRNMQGDDYAVFDMAFTYPSQYTLIAIGEQTDSSASGNTRGARWVTREPTDNATFNLGLFAVSHTAREGGPPVDVFISQTAHDMLARDYMRAGILLPEQRHMSEAVGADVTNSLAVFTELFGPPPYQHFYVTEIPYSMGVSFPGMIDLSWGTFQGLLSFEGFEQFFRAHEVSHQWWGNGVRPASYRDDWLAEGFATFYGLWYLQSLRRSNEQYYRFLDQYRADIGTVQSDVGPLSLSYRNNTPIAPRGHDIITYRKGAWVLHMLRIMMLDLSTLRAERFTETLRDFYQTFTGRSASTADFQATVERHLGVSLDWFFDEWVRGTGVPRYHVAWGVQPAGDGRFRVGLHITQEHVPAEFRMPVLVSADLGGGRTARFRVTVTGAQTDYQSPLLPAAPRSITFNEFHSVLADVDVARQ